MCKTEGSFVGGAGDTTVTDRRHKSKRPGREFLLAFKAQCDDVVPGEIRCAEDMLDLPLEVHERIRRDLVTEHLVGLQNMKLPKR